MNTNEKPLVKLFQTSNIDYYMFDANRNYIIQLEKSIYNIIRELLEHDFYKDSENCSNDSYRNFYNRAIQQGFFKKERVKEIKHPFTDFVESILADNIEAVTLQLTQNCNLRCSYCPYTGNYYNNRKHNNKKMSLETAKKGIDFLYRHSKNTKRINIGLYGGEPFLEKKLILECLEYADKLFEGKEVIYSITTNGTLIDKEIMDILCRFNVYLTVSFDGPRSIHDKSRVYENGTGSFDKIIKNLKFMKENFAEYFNSRVVFNTVVEQKKGFSCIDDFFAANELFQDNYVGTTFFSDNYVIAEPETDKDFFQNAEYEKFKFLMSQFEKAESKSLVFSNYFTQLIETAKMLSPKDRLPQVSHPGGPCIPGQRKLFLNANGNFYPCERVNEDSNITVIGNINDGLHLQACKTLLNIGKLTEDSCQNCWAFLYCKMCVAQADDTDCLSSKKRLSKCREIKDNVLENFKDICVMKAHKFSFIN